MKVQIFQIKEFLTFWTKVYNISTVSWEILMLLRSRELKDSSEQKMQLLATKYKRERNLCLMVPTYLFSQSFGKND